MNTKEFVAESNRIGGIREPTVAEIKSTMRRWLHSTMPKERQGSYWKEKLG